MSQVALEKLSGGSFSFAESSQGAALSALFWWLIPLTALTGAIIYVIWVTRFKSKYENRIDRSVDRFRKFQDSFNSDSEVANQKGREIDREINPERNR